MLTWGHAQPGLAKPWHVVPSVAHSFGAMCPIFPSFFFSTFNHDLSIDCFVLCSFKLHFINVRAQLLCSIHLVRWPKPRYFLDLGPPSPHSHLYGAFPSTFSVPMLLLSTCHCIVFCLFFPFHPITLTFALLTFASNTFFSPFW